MTDRNIATKIAWAYLGKPYIWGGDDPVAGFDCSGFVVELLKSVGWLPMDGDWTADGLWHYPDFERVGGPRGGILVFWGRDEHATHVEYCINNRFSIGARGGDSETLTVADAIHQNAYIMVRPIRGRGGLLGFVDPQTS